jgi:hypothetical protein
VVGYHLQAFSPAERNYPIYDREYLGVLRGLRHWRHLLTGTPGECPVLVFTDHANLQYYRDPRKIPACVHSWNTELADYHIKIIYKPGPQNHTDTLSHDPNNDGPMSNNEEVVSLNTSLFSLDSLERQTLAAAISLDND